MHINIGSWSSICLGAQESSRSSKVVHGVLRRRPLLGRRSVPMLLECVHVAFAVPSFSETVTSAQPLSGTDPACSSIRGGTRVGWVAMIELVAFDAMSSSAMPLHLFGLKRSPFRGRMLRTTCVLDLGRSRMR